MAEVSTKERSLASLALMQLVAGGCAGFVEVSIMHPLDVMKTRLQIQRGADDPTRYRGLVDCFRTMRSQEGILSFYRGILPPLLAETPKRATKFFTYERYIQVFSYGNYLPQPVAYSISGLCSGLTEALVINPFEVVKVKLQAERNKFAEQKSTIQTAKEIYAKDGFFLKGLNKGLTATLGRHGVFNMIYFGFYNTVKGIVPEMKDPKLDFGRRFLIGLASGITASCINIPFDVAKSRIQGPQPIPGEIKYKSCFRTIAMVYREEGFAALYKGLLPKVLRLGPGGAIMFLVYETSLDFMKQHF